MKEGIISLEMNKRCYEYLKTGEHRDITQRFQGMEDIRVKWKGEEGVAEAEVNVKGESRIGRSEKDWEMGGVKGSWGFGGNGNGSNGTNFTFSPGWKDKLWYYSSDIHRTLEKRRWLGKGVFFLGAVMITLVWALLCEKLFNCLRCLRK